MNASPSRASCSSLTNIRRQIFVAAASSGRASPKASIISQPSYPIAFKRVEILAPADISFPRRAAIVFRNVHVAQHVGASPDRGGYVLLLDVRMERVVHRPAVGVAHFLDEARGIRMRVQQVAFEAIQALQAEHDADVPRVFRDLPHAVNRPFPLVLGRSFAAEDAQCRMEGPDEMGGAGRGGAVQRAFGVRHALGPHGRIRADGVVVASAHRHRRSLQSQVIQSPTPLSIVQVVVEEGQFNAVISHLLQRFEHRQQALVHLTRPKQQVHSEFHEITPNAARPQQK